MKTHSINSLSLELEVDRSTLVRALRDIEPDAGSETNRPTYKILTAVNALAAQRAKNPRADGRQQFNMGTEIGDDKVVISCKLNKEPRQGPWLSSFLRGL